ncbi:probable serine/threonine-protein kinase DDB_G0272282 [Uranotaenia lowii]|uniref:probable serine/threonine-protein kinase DDB_G0272282 n=1 Tax=Uranotaenia lowii TaxID=190385 RepID=UPI0024797197|nr:probable serine/threonine-protein kinase DDB_G0272282 [Uranotaenia lowii]
MTLPTNNNQSNNNNNADDDSDIFGPPHTSPPIRRNRPKVPMISAQLRMREVRKRILQLCVHKLERIKDSERNLRRSVCINNTYSRLTDDIRREKQNKYLMLNQLVKSDNDLKNNDSANNNNNNVNNKNNENRNNSNYQLKSESKNNDSNSFNNNNEVTKTPKRTTSVETDLETLDRELCALDAAMPLVDPEITQNAEKLEQVSRKRKFSQMDDDDNDRLVREALSQFYLPSHRPLTGIDDYPSHLLGSNNVTPSVPVSLSPSIDIKRTKVDLLDGSSHHHHHHHHHHHSSHLQLHNHHPFHSLPDLNVALELSSQNHHHHHQKDFEVIMDALRIGAAAGNTMNGPGGSSCNIGLGNIDSCGQAAMMMAGETGSVFHNLVVTSLET